MTLIVVRHGQSQANKFYRTFKNVACKTRNDPVFLIDPDLTDLGWTQCCSAGDKIAEYVTADHKEIICLSSQFSRARRTAALTKDALENALKKRFEHSKPPSFSPIWITSWLNEYNVLDELSSDDRFVKKDVYHPFEQCGKHFSSADLLEWAKSSTSVAILFSHYFTLEDISGLQLKNAEPTVINTVSELFIKKLQLQEREQNDEPETALVFSEG